MTHLENLAEGGALMDALEALDKRGWSLGDGDIEAFRLIFAAGRDFARSEAAAENARLTWVIQTATGHLEALQGMTALNLLRAALAAGSSAAAAEGE